MLTKIQKEYFLKRLCEFLKIRSISSDPAYRSEMLRAVVFVKRELSKAGFKKMKTYGTKAPVVYAERLEAPGAPTVLIYGHCDVQPADPIELWKTPPFEPTIRGGKIFARGATDDKGQLYTHLAALQILNQEFQNQFPFNLKVLIEGEEESGGEVIEKLISRNPAQFKADLCLVSDTGFISEKIPAIEVGLRGLVYFELEIITGSTDRHSGLFGGAIHNPLNLIAEIMLKVKSKVTDSRLRSEPTNARYPSFDIHGIIGGFQGEGSKTVIPNCAKVKFSVRLIPGQKAEMMNQTVEKVIKQDLPKSVKAKLKLLGQGEAFLIPQDSRYLKIAQSSLQKTFGKHGVFTYSGGSIPILATIAKHLTPHVILMGYGLPDDNLHAPNEKFNLKQFYKGIECNVDFLKRLIKLR